MNEQEFLANSLGLESDVPLIANSTQKPKLSPRLIQLLKAGIEIYSGSDEQDKNHMLFLLDELEAKKALKGQDVYADVVHFYGELLVKNFGGAR